MDALPVPTPGFWRLLSLLPKFISPIGIRLLEFKLGGSTEPGSWEADLAAASEFLPLSMLVAALPS